ncbi:c-type cytochrome [Neolewinella litorea]|uniref:Cytochrome c n=1 Tax=Neolewinella litorea TaxID=2562452 RepID=A0A4S4NJB5_9BACT|nr:cytochrome c [Neolewinella litorea]THH39884.1 cytochrome c [Neolewinella litorea]
MENKQGAMNRLAITTGCLILIVAYLFTGCTVPRTRPLAEVVEMPTEDLQAGRIMFNNKCGSCHPGGRSAVGPSIINKPLPKFLVRWQIRHGAGVMPAFDEAVLTDEEVAQIADYVAYLRKQAKRSESES